MVGTKYMYIYSIFYNIWKEMTTFPEVKILW